jgi:hypothetical protein
MMSEMIYEPRRGPQRLALLRRQSSAAARGDGTLVASTGRGSSRYARARQRL